MHPDDLRLNPRVVSAAPSSLVRAELSRLGFPGDVRDLAPPRLASMWIAIENLTGPEAYDLRARWTAGGGEVLVAGDPAAVTTGPALVRGTPDQFERAAQAMPGSAAAATLARAARAYVSRPAPILGLEWGKRTHLMAILNITPDSFSDGGKHSSAEAAIAHGEKLAAAGADMIDVGGESTRPGAETVPAEEEIRRVVPAIRELSKRLKVPISIDTTKAAVARAALDAGAAIVNDISGFRFDSAMASLVAERRVPAVLMHIRGTPATMQHSPQYRDPVSEICSSLRESIRLAEAAGIPENLLIVDPGIGFGKALEHNLDIMARISEFRTLGRPLLVGVSRKSFIGLLADRKPDRRDAISTAVGAACVVAGADLLRVHEVEETSGARKVVDAIVRGAR